MVVAMTTIRTDTGSMELTVGKVAERYGITVRTLRHYDEVGLVRPSARSAAGYRLYDDADLARLATVVGYRRLGLPLERITRLLDDEGSVLFHLQQQREAVADRIKELQHLAAALDRAIDIKEETMTDSDLRDVFGGAFDESWATEAEERWGDTDAWAESRRRTASYTRGNWEEIKTEADATTTALAEALRRGQPATSQAAMDAAETHRAHIDRWFYSLDHDFHRNLGDMYATDPRFTATYDEREPGLAAYVRDAIHANADRQPG